METLSSEVPSLIIPLIGTNLLIPNACVAEIITTSEAVSPAEPYPWLIREQEWRGLEVPYIAFDFLKLSETHNNYHSEAIVIMNTLGRSYSKRFYGFLVNKMPKLVRIQEQELTEHNVDKKIYEKAHVIVNDTACVIPDLEAIELLLKEYEARPR